MFTVVPSRFQGLKIEDEEGFRWVGKPKKNSKPAAVPAPKQTAVKNGPAKQQPPKKQKPKPPKNKGPNEADQNEQWSKWQQKDTEILEKSYMSDLEQALLQSKLDFEANKPKYDQAEKDAKQQSAAAKPRKPKALSLHEFQEKVDNDMKQKEQQRHRKQVEDEYNKNYTFFEQIDLETKQIINKEQMKALFQTKDISAMANSAKNASKKGGKRTAANETPSELDLLKAENKELKEQLYLLSFELKNVALKLSSAEMKEKGELLLEIEQLKRVQEDMTAEMTALYGELEQAKSKSNQDAKFKDKTKLRKAVQSGNGTEQQSTGN
ncbi:Enn protein [Anopheles darlingi]|uniref:Enn protein n=1 Tax=Anopheles darlingi TaxID=43151 RepID=W5J555_ANODA|nr:Enn protein [Anopheles darlingi]